MKARPTGGGLAVAASTILVATVAACAAADGQPPSHCDDLTPPPGATLQPSRDLYCLYLTPRHGLDYMSGHLELRTPHTPFGIAVNAAGNHLYEGILTLSGLPDPGALGDFEHFVAWIASPHFDTVASLGPVANGTRSIGEIGINKFMILVTAEARPDAPEWEGRLLLRASSPSARMSPPDMQEFMLGGLQTGPTEHAGAHAPAPTWPHPPMMPGLTMFPALMALNPPAATPFLPGAGARRTHPPSPSPAPATSSNSPTATRSTSRPAWSGAAYGRATTSCTASTASIRDRCSTFRRRRRSP